MRLITACKRILLGSLLYTVSLSAAAELVPIAVVDFTASSSIPVSFRPAGNSGERVGKQQ